MDIKSERRDSVEMNHRGESGKGVNVSDSIKTEIKTEPMDEGTTSSETMVKGELYFFIIYRNYLLFCYDISHYLF